eukprot:TRINITY_DN39173_c0_g1_i1.p1 TRINITY_DN39173_c0_g1~~TRINITY_DN39173_c0_g1_i1.p1  ORF type:complete len:205 (+),score=43.55 TRINITY_DN39173_c0_g1_i1:266-880(+)
MMASSFAISTSHLPTVSNRSLAAPSAAAAVPSLSVRPQCNNVKLTQRRAAFSPRFTESARPAGRRTVLHVAATEGVLGNSPEEVAQETAPATEEAAAAVRQEETLEVEEPSTKAKKALMVPKKQLLVLRFLWLEKNIGIGLDQLVPGHGTVPISPYMFWPRKDAWEELKLLLDEKPWVSSKRAIILLNQATDIINLWQQTTFKQ